MLSITRVMVKLQVYFYWGEYFYYVYNSKSKELLPLVRHTTAKDMVGMAIIFRAFTPN